LSGGKFSFEDADRLAEQAAPGGDGVLAFLGPGPLSAPNAGLRMGGILMPTPLTFQELSPGQILRSYLESVAYSIKANLDTISDVTGRPATSMCLGGSMSKSDVLAATLADVLEIPVYRSRESQVSAMGAAAAAWVSAGEAASLEEGVSMQVPNFDEFLPEPLRSAEYLDHYHRWLEMFHSLTPRE
jgi:sugar (pentulose or hexulose) kinase